MYALAVVLFCILGGVCAYVLFSRVFLTCWKLLRDARQMK